jgi:hypothetical protein
MTFEKFAHTLALTESFDDPEAWGDYGQACGRWQMHPAFYAQWHGEAVLGETWDEEFKVALKRFWDAGQREDRSVAEMVAGFHLHGQPSGNPADCPEYVARFQSLV